MKCRILRTRNRCRPAWNGKIASPVYAKRIGYHCTSERVIETRCRMEKAAASWQGYMENIMNALTRAPVLRFYDVNQPIQIESDASQTGLGVCLLQDGKPVAYISRAMTQAEMRYAQIEEEMLAICFACHKFHQYIYGKDTLVETDHKPLHMLQAIFNKPIAMASLRLQRMLVRLQRYSLKVRCNVCKRGTSMYLSDALSRAYITDSSSALEQEIDMEVLVHTFY